MKTKLNRFAAALSDLLETSRISLRELAAASGVSPGDISRYRGGKVRVSRLSAARIVQALSPSDGVPLLVAYLRDEIPPEYEPFVQIISTLTALREDTPSEPQTRWQKALKWVSEQENNPSTRDWLIGTAELILGTHPDLQSDDS